jgi:hypothetical protein
MPKNRTPKFASVENSLSTHVREASQASLILMSQKRTFLGLVKITAPHPNNRFDNPSENLGGKNPLTADEP